MDIRFYPLSEVTASNVFHENSFQSDEFIFVLAALLVFLFFFGRRDHFFRQDDD